MRSLNILIFLVLPFISALFVKPISKFPFLVDSIFHLQIFQDQNNGKLSILAGDTMVIRIVNRSEILKQQQVLHYGIRDSIENEIKGEFMDIKIWEVNKNGSAIELSILFKRKSNYNIFEIYFIDASSKILLRKKLNNLKLAKLIYQETIKLYKPSSLQLIINTITTNFSQWNINDTIVAICRAYDGIPVEIPIFENFDKFQQLKSSMSLERNERKITFKVQRKNHFTNLRCVAGKVFKTHLIKVLHNPSQLYIEPEINSILKPNSTIKCYVIDGYPQPRIEWNLNEGPLNSSEYYTINENGTQLHINEKCPLKSKWQFTCHVNGIINKSIKQFNRTIDFFVENKLIGQCNVDCLHARLLEVEYSTRNLDKFLTDLIFYSVEKKIENKDDFISIEKLIRKDRTSSLIRIFNENKFKLLSNYVNRIEKQITDFQNKLKEILNFISQNKNIEIDGLKQELMNFKQNLNFSISNNLKLIIKYIEITDNMRTFKQQINEKIMKIENVDNQLKQDNVKLNQSLVLLINNQNKEIQKLNNTIKNLRKEFETKISKETKINKRNCPFLPHTGEILTKGDKGEFHEWKIFEVSKLENKSFSIYSPSFYFLSFGYHVQLGMHSEPNYRNLNISFQLVPGQFDAHLVWPMKNDIDVSIKNQKYGHNEAGTIKEVFLKSTCENSESFRCRFQIMKKKEIVLNDTMIVNCRLWKKLFY